MLSIIKSLYLQGLNGLEVEIQVDVSNGIPKYTIVGLPDCSLKESRERVITAIKNTGFDLASKKIIINLSPANIRKGGAIFDLSIALGILFSTNLIDSNILNKIDDTIFIGELSLDGRLKHISGILPICMEAKRIGKRKVIVPAANLKETAYLKGIEVLGANSLKDVILYLYKEKNLVNQQEIKSCNFIKDSYDCDFADISGQEFAKRAIEVAVSGGHNIVLIGEPGSGKTMLAQRIPTIMPEANIQDIMEMTRIYSLAGELTSEESLIVNRPFRNPNHGATIASMIGGGINIKPGEFSLADRGVLFLDEFPEFRREVIEALREPMESGLININRYSTNVTFPADFMLVAAMNPCQCGFLGSDRKKCKCSEKQIKNYMRRISGPVMDRIDLQVEMNSIDCQKLYESKSESSESIKKRVQAARDIQNFRYKNYVIKTNSKMNIDMIRKFCIVNRESQNLLAMAYKKLNLTIRGYYKILKIARTIADLEQREEIQTSHIAEAIQYRSLDRKYDFNEN